MLLERLQRIAISRVVSDLIEADFIIEASEMECLEKLKREFKISKDMLIEAKSRTLEWAIDTLRLLKEEEKVLIKNALLSLSVADGTCVPSEALQMIAFLLAMDDKASVFSLPSNSGLADNMKVIYLENEEDTEASKFISDNYRALCNEFQLAGFDFVYIPKLVEDFRRMESDYLHKVISYIIPSMSDERINAIQDDLYTMSTSRFCLEILYGKMGLQVLGTKPALLIKTGESFIVESDGEDARSEYSNYMKIDLASDIHKQIICFLDEYRSMVDCHFNVDVRPRSGKFIYTGFHRSLFDMIAFFKKQATYRMVIDISKRKEGVLLLKSEEDHSEVREIKLTSQAMALYLLLVRQSVFADGLDWRENIGKQKKEEILSKFHILYKHIGNRELPSDYKDRTLMSRIKSELRKLQNSVININQFIPDLKKDVTDSIYGVPVPSDKVFVIENGKEVLMKASDFWKTL